MAAIFQEEATFFEDQDQVSEVHKQDDVKGYPE